MLSKQLEQQLSFSIEYVIRPTLKLKLREESLLKIEITFNIDCALTFSETNPRSKTVSLVMSHPTDAMNTNRMSCNIIGNNN
jgi:hypothetical protein